MGVVAVDVDVDEFHFRILESGVGTGGEIIEPAPHAEDQVSLALDFAACGVPARSAAAQRKL